MNSVKSKHEFELKLNRVLVDPQTPPKPVHRLMWTRVGDMVCLELGYMDLPELRGALQQAEQDAESGKRTNPVVNFHVTDRFTVTPSAAKQVHTELTSLIQDLERESLILQGAKQ